jgi:predicted peptidase
MIELIAFFSHIYSPNFLGNYTAVVAICGWANPLFWLSGRNSSIKSVPVWALHSAEDEVILLEWYRVLVDVLKANNGNIKFTIYPDITMTPGLKRTRAMNCMRGCCSRETKIIDVGQLV